MRANDRLKHQRSADCSFQSISLSGDCTHGEDEMFLSRTWRSLVGDRVEHLLAAKSLVGAKLHFSDHIVSCRFLALFQHVWNVPHGVKEVK